MTPPSANCLLVFSNFAPFISSIVVFLVTGLVLSAKFVVLYDVLSVFEIVPSPSIIKFSLYFKSIFSPFVKYDSISLFVNFLFNLIPVIFVPSSDNTGVKSDILSTEFSPKPIYSAKLTLSEFKIYILFGNVNVSSIVKFSICSVFFQFSGILTFALIPYEIGKFSANSSLFPL